MLTYNTQQKNLILPEYGRNIQKMVDYCLTIPDREERTICAHHIIRAMANIQSNNLEGNEGLQKLWDHLAIISNFQLDIDYPNEIIPVDSLNSTPQKIPYQTDTIRYKHYGKNIENLIGLASTMEENEERNELIRLIANHMKKMMLNVNPEGVDDDKIFKDLLYLSHGSIVIDPQNMKLHEFKAAPIATNTKKKKKK